jgi:hypothetical protein
MSRNPLTRTQDRVLIHKQLTGDFPPRQWKTIIALIAAGMLEDRAARLYVTSQGKAYCAAHHQDFNALDCPCHRTRSPR